eukprot:scaffold244006_cov50-Attheya_sp.AAC.1
MNEQLQLSTCLGKQIAKWTAENRPPHELRPGIFRTVRESSLSENSSTTRTQTPPNSAEG